MGAINFIITFNSGTKQAIAHISPTQVHPNNGESHHEKATRNCVERLLQWLRLGPEDAEGGDGEAHEESEGGSGGDQARAVLDQVAGGPRKGEGGGEVLVLVYGLLLQGNRAFCLCWAAVVASVSKR